MGEGKNHSEIDKEPYIQMEASTRASRPPAGRGPPTAPANIDAFSQKTYAVTGEREAGNKLSPLAVAAEKHHLARSSERPPCILTFGNLQGRSIKDLSPL